MFLAATGGESVVRTPDDSIFAEVGVRHQNRLFYDAAATYTVHVLAQGGGPIRSLQLHVYAYADAQGRLVLHKGQATLPSISTLALHYWIMFPNHSHRLHSPLHCRWRDDHNFLKQ